MTFFNMWEFDREKVEEYYKKEDLLSYTKLSIFKYSPREYKRKYIDKVREFPSDGMRIGSALEKYTIARLLEKDLDVVIVDKLPTGQMKKLIEHLYEGNNFQEAYDKVGFKRDSIKNVEEKYEEYKDFLIKTLEGFTVISKDEALLVEKMYVELFTDEISSEIFKNGGKLQYPVYFRYKEDFKILPDIIVEDGGKIKIYDQKYCSFNFRENYEKYNYRLQASLYYIGIKVKNSNKEVEFYFLVSTPEYPKIYKVSEKEIEKGIEEISTLTDDLEWHTKNELWNHGRRYYTNKYEEI